jgi:hypothetical protein
MRTQVKPTPTEETMIREYLRIGDEYDAAHATWLIRENEIRTRQGKLLHSLSGSHGALKMLSRSLGVTDVQVSRRIRDGLVRAVRHALTDVGAISDTRYEMVFHAGNRAIGLVSDLDDDVVADALAVTDLVVVGEKFRAIPDSERRQERRTREAIASVKAVFREAGVSPRAYQIGCTYGSCEFMANPVGETLPTLVDALTRIGTSADWEVANGVIVFTIPEDTAVKRRELVITWK